MMLMNNSKFVLRCIHIIRIIYWKSHICCNCPIMEIRIEAYDIIVATRKMAEDLLQVLVVFTYPHRYGSK